MVAQAARKYRVLFKPFFDAMVNELARHDKEKGDSWMICTDEFLDNKLADTFNTRKSDVDQNVDIANVAGFRWLRKHYKDKGIWG